MCPGDNSAYRRKRHRPFADVDLTDLDYNAKFLSLHSLSAEHDEDKVKHLSTSSYARRSGALASKARRRDND
jgi:hypothetical protein